MTYDFLIVGGGIVGLATARALAETRRGASILLIEKEESWAAHQTGRNSGVIHSGIYYRPGTLKARLGVAGNASMVAYCVEHGIPHRVCGKLIVAATDDEIAPLRRLEQNAAVNGITTRWLSPAEAHEFEPHVACVAALHVASTGVVDYRVVSESLAVGLGGAAELRAGAQFLEAHEDYDHLVVETTAGVFQTRMMINCAGLFSDRVAVASGSPADVRIVPFRGEYHSVGGASASLVRTLIYPVPNPDFPFLGVHLTRSVDDHVHAGPNAVLAFSREGYRWRDVDLHDMIDTFTYPGFWRIAGRYWDEGAREMLRSVSRRRFADSVRRLVPEIAERDLVRAPAGVRAQALTRDGTLADDFVIVRTRRAIHVCNAPSPAATASLEIGRYVAGEGVGAVS